MAQPEREMRRDYEATQQMQVTQLQNEYAQRGFTILHAGAELAGVRRGIWAAYDPKTGDTYMFSGTRETSFGTGQSVLDAVAKWVERRNTDMAFNATMEDIQRQSDIRASRETVRRMDDRMQAYFTESTPQQPVQAARETPAQPAARTAEPVREERAIEAPRTAPITPPVAEASPVVRPEILAPEEQRIIPGTIRRGQQETTAPAREQRATSNAAQDQQLQTIAEFIREGRDMRLPFRSPSGVEIIVTIHAGEMSEVEREFHARRAERRTLATPAGIGGLFNLSREKPAAVEFTYRDGTAVSAADLR
ncbi:MAG TPA: hypothetical protein PKJ97_01865, partial [Candidatus Bilamarchaeaceae archaeon]|nr:hypothetical protein [Candidatus Bilamarchaeaceae archaeon]